MNDRKTFSILQRFSRVLEVTATYLGLPKAQPLRIPVVRPMPLPIHRQSHR